jgi:hypothetical protein
MIDVYATAGTFTDKHQLAADLAAALMSIEGVPDIPMFRQNTAAFVHELPPGGLANVFLFRTDGGASPPDRVSGQRRPGRRHSAPITALSRAGWRRTGGTGWAEGLLTARAIFVIVLLLWR